MRTWMIPWLFPLAILVLAIAFLVAPPWVGGIVAFVIVVLALLGLRPYLLEDGGKLPGWLSSRGVAGGTGSTRRWGRRDRP